MEQHDIPFPYVPLNEIRGSACCQQSPQQREPPCAIDVFTDKQRAGAMLHNGGCRHDDDEKHVKGEKSFLDKHHVLMIMTKNDYEYVGIVLDIMYFEKR